ncbi:MAG: thioredoxin domain-containing protein [bacterium]|nr:thioredoxin domain-containing protein [bacterium]
MKKGVIIFWVVVLVLVVVGIGASVVVNSGPGKLDNFARCLKDSGTVYYGAFWCPHCQATNKLFGKSKPLLPYVECSTPDGKGQTQICKDKNITGYPTWIFPATSTTATSTILTGERTLQELATASGCTLPQ